MKKFAGLLLVAAVLALPASARACGNVVASQTVVSHAVATPFVATSFATPFAFTNAAFFTPSVAVVNPFAQVVVNPGVARVKTKVKVRGGRTRVKARVR